MANKRTKSFYYIMCLLLLFAISIFCVGFNNLIDVTLSASIQIEEFKDDAPENLQELQNASVGQIEHWASNLGSFDGRQYNYITRHDNQGGLGLCWAYAAVGAVEANILRDSVDAGVNRETLNLDERIAAYARFNRDGQFDPLYLTTNDVYSTNDWRSCGDFADNAFMSMTQGFSLVNQVSAENWLDSDYVTRLAQSKYFVQGFKQIEHTNEAIKQAILEYGGVTMEYQAPDSTVRKYLYHAENATGHASLIIGWDDSIPKELFGPSKPSDDGAWIVKNSWGYGGDGGVNGTCAFYLSYNSYMSNDLFVVDMGLREDYQNIYYYDGSISDNTIQYTADAYGAIYEAKLTTINQQEKLTAVSFGIRNNKSTVDIDIYKLDEANFSNVNAAINRPDAGQRVGFKHNVYFEDDGFYTVDLDEPINLMQGEIFSIVISGRDSNNGCLNPYFAQDYIDSVNDMTYMKYGNEWTSFKGYKDSYPGNSNGLCVRLRAITNVEKTFNYYDNDLTYARMELDSKLVYYEKGISQTPALMVYIGNRILQVGKDYEVSYFNNLEPGIATVTIKGINNYLGEQTTTFEIAKPAYPPGMISGPIEVYSNTTRLYQVPVPKGWQWGETQDIVLKTGESEWAYQLKYIGDDARFYQKITYSVKILKNDSARPLKVDIDGSNVLINDKYFYTGSQIQPSVWIVCKGHELIQGKDYTLKYQNNTDAGTATVVITGQGDYTGQITKQFEIKKAIWPIERPESIIKVEKDIKKLSEIALNCQGWNWKDDLDITDDYIEVTAIYSGSNIGNYYNKEMIVTIIRESDSETQPKNLYLITINLEGEPIIYDGSQKEPNVIATDGDYQLVKDIDFEVKYFENTNAGKARAVISGIDKYTGTRTIYFTINRADIQGFGVSQQGWIFGETAPEPTIIGQVGAARVTYTYSDRQDGTYTENKPTKAGDYWIKAVVEQSQNYNAAEAIASFTIEKADHPENMPNTEITISRKAKTLQDVNLDTEGWQWETPSTKINGESMKATAIYSDKENYKNYTIQITLTKEPPKEVSQLSVEIETENFVYDGTEKTPKVIAKDGDLMLALGEDYYVQFESNIFVGNGKVIVTFKNNYTGTMQIGFTISKAEKPQVKTTLKIHSPFENLSEVDLPDNFEWVIDSLQVISETKMIAKAIYNGSDANCYETTELTFEIIIEEEQNNPYKNLEQGNLIWVAIVVPVAVLFVGCVVFAIVKHKKNNG